MARICATRDDLAAHRTSPACISRAQLHQAQAPSLDFEFGDRSMIGPADDGLRRCRKRRADDGVDGDEVREHGAVIRESRRRVAAGRARHACSTRDQVAPTRAAFAVAPGKIIAAAKRADRHAPAGAAHLAHPRLDRSDTPASCANGAAVSRQRRIGEETRRARPERRQRFGRRRRLRAAPSPTAQDRDQPRPKPLSGSPCRIRNNSCHSARLTRRRRQRQPFSGAGASKWAPVAAATPSAPPRSSQLDPPRPSEAPSQE